MHFVTTSAPTFGHSYPIRMVSFTWLIGAPVSSQPLKITITSHLLEFSQHSFTQIKRRKNSQSFIESLHFSSSRDSNGLVSTEAWSLLGGLSETFPFERTTLEMVIPFQRETVSRSSQLSLVVPRLTLLSWLPRSKNEREGEIPVSSILVLWL